MIAVQAHYQAGKPVHWALRNDVDLPGVRHLSGSIARVFEILRLTQETAHCFRVGQGMAPAGWVPVWVFREPWAGGSAGDRRLRDLRRLGVELEGKPYDAGSGSSSWIWRLAAASGTQPPPGRPIPRGKPTEPKAQVSAAPLAGVSVRLCSARPVLYAGLLVDLSPGMPHVAAPTASLAQRVAEGTLSAAEAQEAYRQHLLAAYRGGELASAFRAAGTALTVCCDAPFDALAVLGRALGRLGATIAAATESAG